MNTNSAKTILQELPKILQEGVMILSVTPALSEEIAKKLLHSSAKNIGTPSEVLQELKGYPIWNKINSRIWSISPNVRTVALDKLNGSTQEMRTEALRIIRENYSEFHKSPYSIQKELEVQATRLALKVPSEQEEAINKLRKYVTTAEIFGDFRFYHVASRFLEESIDFNDIVSDDRKDLSEEILSALFVKGRAAYLDKDYPTALTCFNLVWKKRKDTFLSKRDASIAAHFVGLIHSKDGNLKKAESALKASIELRSREYDRYGLAMTYHSLGKLLSRKEYSYRRDEAKSALLNSHNLFKEEQKTYGDIKRVLQGLAQISFALGMLEEDVSEKKRLFQVSIDLGNKISYHTHLAYVHLVRGNFNVRINEFDEAISDYEKSLKLERDNIRKQDYSGLAKVLAAYGEFEFKRSNFDKSRELLTEAIKYELDTKTSKRLTRLLQKTQD